MAKATTMGPMKIKESASYRVFKVFNAIILTLISVAMLYPFLYLVAQSFSSTQAIVAGEVGLIPKDFNISTYKYVITDGKFIPYYGNTIVYSIIGTVCALLFSALLAYPFQGGAVRRQGHQQVHHFHDVLWRRHDPQLHFDGFLGSARYRGILHPARHDLHLLRHPDAFLLPHSPRELEEAGEIDGLDLWGVFWRIAIPCPSPSLPP